jgi:hypothetical protein
MEGNDLFEGIIRYRFEINSTTTISLPLGRCSIQVRVTCNQIRMCLPDHLVTTCSNSGLKHWKLYRR